MSDSIEAQVQRLNDQVSALQSFMMKNTEAISTLPAHVNGLLSNKESKARITFWNSNKADVARWFGADGWKRNQTAIGIDYEKMVDGVLLIIDQAEPLRPTTDIVSPSELLK